MTVNLKIKTCQFDGCHTRITPVDRLKGSCICEKLFCRFHFLPESHKCIKYEEFKEKVKQRQPNVIDLNLDSHNYIRD